MIQPYKKINKDLSDNVETLFEEVNNLKQEKFEQNLIMLGIPQESDAENLANTVLLITKKIGSQLSEDDIVEVKRLGNAPFKISGHQNSRTPFNQIKTKLNKKGNFGEEK